MTIGDLYSAKRSAMILEAQGEGNLVLVYKCGQEKSNNLYY